jgi:hypothetical protein
MSNLSYTEFHCTSDQFTDGDNNRPEFRLTHQLQKVRKIKVANAVIPVSYYNVNSNNNTFSWEESAGGGVITSTFTAGNYTSTTFATEVKTQMDADTNNTATYTVTISTATNKMTITAGANFTIYVAVSQKLTGFTTVPSASTTQIGDNVINLAGPNQLYLRSNIATRIDTNAVVKNDKIFNNVLAIVPINVNTFDVVYKSFDYTQYFESDIDIQDIEFYFTDDDDNIIDFNGAPFSLSLQMFRETRASR